VERISDDGVSKSYGMVMVMHFCIKLRYGYECRHVRTISKLHLKLQWFSQLVTLPTQVHHFMSLLSAKNNGHVLTKESMRTLEEEREELLRIKFDFR
jgi:hypothetical protein